MVNDGKTILKYIKYTLTLLIFIFIFLLFSWWGVIGYVCFVAGLAAYILYQRRKDYLAIVDYGCNQLKKVFGGNENGRRKK